MPPSVLIDNLSERLARCETDAERAVVWSEFVESHADELGESTQRAAQLIQEGDIEGLRQHLSRHARERAAAHVARLRGQPAVTAV